ncbi:hypothetical protein SCLCIDRAFT_1207430 [Scleroderma citrinum Foug A]|uniref:Uncharacterized protein n=1 Tax=Scleroderma citrinum Foug A TaxID=1036808 RepID=A0A0C3AYS5_9AGAM|nr:hypothetical protein SCLCIDRAFT_1207430 [Scleroderma citrinum Foug A]
MRSPSYTDTSFPGSNSRDIGRSSSGWLCGQYHAAIVFASEADRPHVRGSRTIAG